MDDVPSYLSHHPDGVRIALRVHPRSSRCGPLGLYGDGGRELKWGVTAAPVDGAANRALIADLAARLRIAKSRIRLLTGETARSKTFVIEGISVAQVLQALDRGENSA